MKNTDRERTTDINKLASQIYELISIIDNKMKSGNNSELEENTIEYLRKSGRIIERIFKNEI